MSPASVEVEQIKPQSHLSQREVLIAAWIKQFGSSPPQNTSALFMQRALSFEQQCRSTPALKRLSKTVQTALKGNLRTRRGSSPTRTAKIGISAGTHLVREWNGRAYQVEVLEDGFVMDGKPYRSLSAIAKKITGTTWSGPLFFGLNKRRHSSVAGPATDGVFDASEVRTPRLSGTSPSIAHSEPLSSHNASISMGSPRAVPA